MKLYKALITFSLLSLLPLSLGAPDSDTKKPKPSSTPTPPPKPPPASSCKDELVCCLELTTPTDPNVALLLGLFHIGLTTQEKEELVGLTCKDIDLKSYAFGDSCLGKAACCDKSLDLGIIAVGCSEVSL